jgi:O-antigen/teichoic acid export membrane protein
MDLLRQGAKIEAPSETDEQAVSPAQTGEGARSLIAAGAYSAGFIVQRAIGLLLLPLYTRAITPAEYGVLGILLAVSIFVGVIFSLGLEAAVTRNYFQLASEPARREEFVQSVWKFLFAFPIVASLLLAAAAWPFASSSSTYSPVDVSLMLVSTALGVASTTVPFALLRARQDLRGYVYLTATVALLTPLLTWLFVVVLDEGVRGWFLAATGANAVAAIVSAAVLPWRPGVRYSGTAVKAAIIFCLPLFPHFISHWALQVADRFVIVGMVSRTSLGIYVLAATLAGAVLAIMQALNSGFVPSYARAGAEPGQESGLAKIVVIQITAVIGVTLAGALLGPSAVEILAEPSYHDAAGVVPLLVLGYGFVGLYYVPMNGAVLGAGRRKFTFIATITAAAANIGLIVLLVPAHGIHGAAAATAGAYLLLLVMISTWAHLGPTPVTYEWAPIARAVAMGIAVYVAAALTTPSSNLEALAVRLGWVGVFAAFLGLVQFRPQIARALNRRRVQ